MKSKYRILKVIYANDYCEESYYVIQKQEILFWFGPKIWKTYEDIYDGWWSSCRWSWSLSNGDRFRTFDDAEEMVKALMKEDMKIKNSEVIKTYGKDN